MYKLIIAVATASLLFAGPVSADRLGHAKNRLTGSAQEQAYNKHRDARRDGWRGSDYRKQVSGHRPAGRDHNGHRDRGRGRGHDRDRDRGHKYSGRGRDYDRGGSHRDKYKQRHPYKHRDRGQRIKRYGKHHRHHWRPDRFRYGYRWRHLPRNFVRISFGGLGLFYNDGIFYRPQSSGYVVSRAPLGAVVHSLPGTAISVVFGGHNYYVAYDTYYLWDSAHRGYRVVANPGFY